MPRFIVYSLSDYWTANFYWNIHDDNIFEQGEDVVKRVEAVGSNSGATSKKVTIADSGEL